MIWYVSNLKLRNGIILVSEYFSVYSYSAISFLGSLRVPVRWDAYLP